MVADLFSHRQNVPAGLHRAGCRLMAPQATGAPLKAAGVPPPPSHCRFTPRLQVRPPSCRCTPKLQVCPPGCRCAPQATGAPSLRLQVYPPQSAAATPFRPQLHPCSSVSPSCSSPPRSPFWTRFWLLRYVLLLVGVCPYTWCIRCVLPWTGVLAARFAGVLGKQSPSCEPVRTSLTFKCL